ncbi:unnamed protein product [Effrenium voratum]|nr:unnamed protein product [Effrenium voratum]
MTVAASAGALVAAVLYFAQLVASAFTPISWKWARQMAVLLCLSMACGGYLAQLLQPDLKSGVWQELAAVLGAHIFNLSAPLLVYSASICHLDKFPEGAHSWLLMGTLLLTLGVMAEVCAHIADGWVYGAVSRHSAFNMIFNTTLVAGFGAFGQALSSKGRRRRTAAAALISVLAMMLSYHLNLKPVQYTFQLVATLLLMLAHAEWSAGHLGVFFLTSAVAIIHCTYVLIASNNQILHVFPSIYSWACWVVPMKVPLELPEQTGRLVVPILFALAGGQIALHELLRDVPSSLGAHRV